MKRVMYEKKDIAILLIAMLIGLGITSCFQDPAFTKYQSQSYASVVTAPELEGTPEQVTQSSLSLLWDAVSLDNMLTQAGHPMQSRDVEIEVYFLKKTPELGSFFPTARRVVQEGVKFSTFSGDVNQAIFRELEPSTAYYVVLRTINRTDRSKVDRGRVRMFTTETPYVALHIQLYTEDENKRIGAAVRDAVLADPVATIRGLPPDKEHAVKIGGVELPARVSSAEGEFVITKADFAQALRQDANSGERDTYVLLLEQGEGGKNTDIAVYNAKKLYSWHDVQAMRADLGATYTVEKDIAFPELGVGGFPNSGFEPVGTDTAPFTGMLNGKGKTITGLAIRNTTIKYNGLFGYARAAATSNAVVERLTLHDPDINVNYMAGALIGLLHTGIVRKVSVTTSDRKSIRNFEMTGWPGMVSPSLSYPGIRANRDILETLHVESRRVRTAGQAPDGNFFFSFSGGLIGVVESAGMVIEGYSEVGVAGQNGTGGLVGGMNGQLLGGIALGDVTGHALVGGLVGECGPRGGVHGYATGDVASFRGSDAHGTGGLVGRNNNIVRGFALGNITGDIHVGGLVGRNVGLGSGAGGETRGRVFGYALGNVRGSDIVGGLVGHNGGGLTSGYARGKVIRLAGDKGNNFGLVSGLNASYDETGRLVEQGVLLSYYDTYSSELRKRDGPAPVSPAQDPNFVYVVPITMNANTDRSAFPLFFGDLPALLRRLPAAYRDTLPKLPGRTWRFVLRGAWPAVYIMEDIISGADVDASFARQPIQACYATWSHSCLAGAGQEW